MKSKRLSLWVAVAGVLVVSPMFAHHGTASFDETKTITLKATITDFQFVNPHVGIYFDVRDDKGRVQKWRAECEGPNLLSRDGWSKNTLKPGDEITISGHPAKSGSFYMRFTEYVTPDGHKFYDKADSPRE